MNNFFLSVVLLVSGLLCASSAQLTESDLQSKIENLRGDDLRLVRWDATNHTIDRRNAGGCDDLLAALQIITGSPSTENEELKRLAADYTTLCVTNHPQNRAVLSTVDGLYKSVIGLLSSSNSLLKAKIGHLIYIAVYANKENHQGFVKEGAVDALSEIVKNDAGVAVEWMWASIALANLAASYCADEENPKELTWCEWDWDREGHGDFLVAPRVVSDGTIVRRQLLKDTSTLLAFVAQVCNLGGVTGQESDSNPFPGSMAISTGRDDDHPNISTWAAIGVLKNLAVEPKARPRLEPHMHCFCRLWGSPDWLESDKAEETIHNQRLTDPCWFDDNDHQGDLHCVDHFYLDENYEGCERFDVDTDPPCHEEDAYGTAAIDACCGCDGGEQFRVHNEL